MDKKNSAEVLINGKAYTISGYESTAYLHKVAAYLNDMEDQMIHSEGYRRLSNDEKQLLKNMNLADAYFKTLEAKEGMEKDMEQMEKELYSLKHDLIEAKLAQDKLRKEIESLQTQLKEEQKKNRYVNSAPARKLTKAEQRL